MPLSLLSALYPAWAEPQSQLTLQEHLFASPARTALGEQRQLLSLCCARANYKNMGGGSVNASRVWTQDSGFSRRHKAIDRLREGAHHGLQVSLSLHKGHLHTVFHS